MAINPETRYAGKITPSSTDYPYGKARNVTLPGDGTGTPYDEAILNDLFGLQQSFLAEAGIVPTGTPDKVGDSQYLDAILKIATRTFDSVADMTAASPKAGTYVRTVAYHPGWSATSTPPKGGAIYAVITDAENGGPGDGLITHTLANGNVARIVPVGGVLLASQCGGQMDGTGAPIGPTLAASYPYPQKYYDNVNDLSPLLIPISGVERPFSATDSFDLAAVQAGIWYASSHNYKFVIDGTRVVFTNNVVMMRGDDCHITGLGMADTEIYNPLSDTTNNAARFRLSQASQNCLFLYYRGDGQPKQISNMKLLGKVGYSTGSTTDFRCIQASNLNGWYPENLWLSSASKGIVMETSCSDIHLGFLVTEYLFKDSIRDDGTCDWNMTRGGNIWASQTATNANGINSGGRLNISGVRFNGFKGGAVIGGEGSVLNNCEFYNPSVAIQLGDNAELTGCSIIGAISNQATVVLGSNSRVVGGSYENVSEHPVFNFVAASALANKNSALIGVRIKKTSTSTSFTNVAVQDEIPGTSYTGASDRLKISGCHFEGTKCSISGCDSALINESNTWTNPANEIQSPAGLFVKAISGIASVGTTTLARISRTDYMGAGVEANFSGMLEGIGSYTARLVSIITWETGLGSINVLSNDELGTNGAGNSLALQVVASGSEVFVQIVNTGSSNFAYRGSLKFTGATRGKVSIG